MMHRPMSRALLVGLSCLTVATWSGPAPADVYFETAYVPTGSVVSMSPGLLPTAYVLPTAYSSSTRYYPTSYLTTSDIVASDSVIYPTSTTIVRRSALRPRRYVERSYYSYPTTAATYVSPTVYLAPSRVVPTTYVTRSSLLPTSYVATSYEPTSYVTSSLLPTSYVTRSYITPTSYVYDDAVVATSSSSSSYPCETSTAPPPRPAPSRPMSPTSAESANTIVSKPAEAPAVLNDRRPQGTVSSMPSPEEAPSSAVKPPDVPAPAKVPGKPETPPGATLPEPDPNDIKVPEPGKLGNSGPNLGETSYRSARRPVSYNGRSILRGRVISAESNLPEEGVSVVLAHVNKNYVDKPTISNADGEFKVSLPDGDWTVKVKMPNGSVYTVGRDTLTASNGRVTDSAGRSVTEFVITR